jgi:RNAse (barnase) inhibitor barstar
MAKKKSHDDAGMNLDSLMDALTNVVAVLILVLLLVQANATKQVEEYFESLEPATEEELAQTQKEMEKLNEEKLKAEELLETEAPDPSLLAKLREEIRLMNLDLSKEERSNKALAELLKLREEIEKERDEEKAKTKAFQEEIAMLESNLDQTPVLKPLPPAEVSIPDSRPIPDNADMYYVIVKGDRVHFIDAATPLKEFENLVKRNKSKWKVESKKRKGDDLVIYDQQKINDFLKTHKLRSPEGHRVTIPPNPSNVRLFMDIYPDLKKGGTDVKDLTRRGNKFHMQLQQLSMKRNVVLMYRVHPDGFQTYLQARKISDLSRIPAGWELNGDIKVRTWMTDISVTRLKDPPPRDPNAPKRPPGPPALKSTLD